MGFRAALGLALLLATPSAAQSPRWARAVDSVFASYSRAAGPGCAVGVSRDGVLQYAQGYGLAEIESKTPIRPGTVFNVGSTSKQFVTFATMLLASQGKLSLDDPVRRFVPELPDFGVPITIRQLIHHTSGLRDYASLLSLMGWNQGDQYDEARFLSLIGAQQALNFPPGSRYLYSNTGYILLATVVSRASGEPWPAFAARAIFGPLGMTSSSVRSDPRATAPGRAFGYSPARGGGWQLEMPNHDITGSTAVMTTVEDLARWTGNYWRPTVGDQALLDLMHHPAILTSGDPTSYAGGLMIDRYRGVPMITHGGATGGYRAQLLRFPGEKAGIAVLCNASNADPDRLARQVADRVLGSSLGPAVAVESGAPISGAAAEPYLGIFADTVAERVIRLTRIDDRLTVQLGPGRTPVQQLSGNRIRAGNTVLEVERDGSGRVVALLSMAADGDRTRYRRMDPPETGVETLDRLTGAWRSAELDRTWWLAVEDGALWLRRRDFAPVRVEPLYGQVYQIPGATLRFGPDPGGGAERLSVSNGRALNVRFDRVVD